MSTLTITVDTSEWFSDDLSFDQFVLQELKYQMKSFVKEAAEGIIKKNLDEAIAELVSTQVETGVEKLLRELLNEERTYPVSAFWGSSEKFVGTFEDFVSFHINDKVNHPTNGQGKRVVGCSTETGHTWLTFFIQKQIDDAFNHSVAQARKETVRFVETEVKRRFDEEQKSIISNTILGRMEQLGILTKGQA